MRLLILLLLTTGFGLSACKKYNLKQPSHLSFNWRVLDNNAGDSTSTIQDIYFYASSLNISGTRTEGEAINLMQSIPAEKISVAFNTFFAIKVDVPMGEYTNLEAGVDFTQMNGSNFGINGNTYVLGTPVRFKVVWENMSDITFRSPEVLNFKKKKDYSLNMCLDFNKLMNGITQSDWDAASVSQDPDGPMILIQSSKNHNLFNKISANLPASVYIQPNK